MKTDIEYLDLKVIELWAVAIFVGGLSAEIGVPYFDCPQHQCSCFFCALTDCYSQCTDCNIVKENILQLKM